MNRHAANLLQLEDQMEIKVGTAGTTPFLDCRLADDTEVAAIQMDGDFVSFAATGGPVIKDRATAAYRRIISTNGTLSTEAD